MQRSPTTSEADASAGIAAFSVIVIEVLSFVAFAAHNGSAAHAAGSAPSGTPSPFSSASSGFAPARTSAESEIPSPSVSAWFGSVPWRKTSSQSERPSPSESAFGSRPDVFLHSSANRAGVRSAPFVQSRSAMLCGSPGGLAPPLTRQTGAERLPHPAPPGAPSGRGPK